jgi:prepilin-type N-terminal cleavage/methylation domain-containing protein
MKNRKGSKQKGFTLTEILVVILIIVVIAAIAYPLYTKSIEKSRAAEAVNLLEIVRTKQISRYVMSRRYYDSFKEMGQLTQNRSREEYESDESKMRIGDYELAMNSGKDCLTATYEKGGRRFTFAASYGKEGLGCEGEICSSFGDVISGSVEEICSMGSGGNGGGGSGGGGN